VVRPAVSPPLSACGDDCITVPWARNTSKTFFSQRHWKLARRITVEGLFSPTVLNGDGIGTALINNAGFHMYALEYMWHIRSSDIFHATGRDRYLGRSEVSRSLHCFLDLIPLSYMVLSYGKPRGIVPT
jgi:hypothetical protein